MMGAPVGYSPQKGYLRGKTIGRCQNRGEEGNVSFIDLEGDSSEKVVIIDITESSPSKYGSCSETLRKGEKVAHPRNGVICLDDDDDDDDDDESRDDSNDGASGRDFTGGASSSRRPSSASGKFGSSSAAEKDECQFVQQNVSPVRLSKGKRTYSGKAPPRNHYGLTESEDAVMFDDYLDCELMEDSYGWLKEQWEKAYSKRKLDAWNGQPGQRDPNKDFDDAQENVNSAAGQGHCEAIPSMAEQTEEEAAGPTIQKEGGNVDYDSDHSHYATIDGGEDIFRDSNLKNPFSYGEDDRDYTQESAFNIDGYYSDEYLEPSFSNLRSEEEQEQERPSPFPYEEKGSVKHVKEAFHEDTRAPPGEPCLSQQPGFRADENFGHPSVNIYEKEPHSPLYKQSVNSELGFGRSSSGDSIESFPERMFGPCLQKDPIHDTNGSKTNLPSHQASMPHVASSHKDATDVANSYDDDRELLPRETFSDKSSVFSEKMVNRKGSCQTNMEQINQMSSMFCADTNENDKGDHSVHGQDDEAMLNDHLMGDRERLKQTDEYKKAIEEEWASRLQALQIQAEEAQKLRRLRKRMKAEAMRLHDMERRQKQRVEEIRETQKKDEENSNLKEIIRAEVRKDLNRLEVSCHDMASLLRGLGIPIGLQPLLNEVRSAYKRALLAFHPDRASRSDVRQQVEAEEKFKLVSRMKEKFLFS